MGTDAIPQGAERPLILALNAAEGRVQIVLGRDGELLCAQDWATASRGTELLAPALKDLFARLRLSFSALGRIACVRGPGSFTGIRLALATAAALARGCGARLAGIDYMRALAQSARSCCEPQNRIAVVTHARRDLVHMQLFVPDEGDSVLPVAEPVALGPRDCAEHLRGLAAGAPLVGLGSAWTRHADLAALGESGLRLLPPRFSNPAPEALLPLAERAVYSDRDIEPFYLRTCDAVENLAEIARRLGDDPAASEARLASLLNAPPDQP